jgi:hypothetical protein
VQGERLRPLHAVVRSGRAGAGSSVRGVHVWRSAGWRGDLQCGREAMGHRVLVSRLCGGGWARYAFFFLCLFPCCRELAEVEFKKLEFFYINMSQSAKI